jgi:deoxycytidine triphosphate deaminase
VFLSNRDIQWAIRCGKLIVDPAPESLGKGYDETSIDLHLGPIKTARVWTVERLLASDRTRGTGDVEHPPEVGVGGFDWDKFAGENQVPIPPFDEDPEKAKTQLVFHRGAEVVVRRNGFVLWMTKERVGTPKVSPELTAGTRVHPELICFVNAKSTKARTGLLVHFTAPTIHAGWVGNITLEITNLGPFTFVLKEGDALAQLTVATISSAPDHALKKSRSQTQDQTDPSGKAQPAG